MNDWYNVLGVGRDAAKPQIKAAYRKLAKRYHPDAHPGDEECETRFRKITEAYTILSDPVKRKKYDEELSRGKTEDFNSRGRRNTKQRAEAYTGTDTVNVDFQNTSKNFEQFFGFNPHTKEVVNQEKLRPGSKTGNPLDTTNIFDAFMGIKR